MTIAPAGFRPVGEVSADDRSRIALGRVGDAQGTRYAATVNDDGDTLFTPLASIPRRELIVRENEQLRDSLMRGLEQSAAGETGYLGSFAAYTEDNEPDE